MKPRNYLNSSDERQHSKHHDAIAKPMKSTSPTSSSKLLANIKRKVGRPARQDAASFKSLHASRRDSEASEESDHRSEHSKSPNLPPVLTSESEQEMSPPKAPRRPAVVLAQCHVCAKRFKRPSWLNYHIQTRHPEEKIPPPVGIPISAISSMAPKTTVVESIEKKHYNCPHCEWKFKNPDRLELHVSQHHGQRLNPTAKQPSPSKPNELDTIHRFFDSISTNQTARIVREFEAILKQTNQFVNHLNAESLSPDTTANFDQLQLSNRSLLTKQFEIYDAATQLISVKRDSLKFAFEDWVQKHAPEPVEIEDYSTLNMDTGVKLELNSDGAIVTEKSAEPCTNGESTHDAQPKPVELKHAECQTNIQGSDLHLSDCLQADGEYEFLDSKTGMYVTNKVIVPKDEEVEPPNDLVELYEVLNSDSDDENMVEMIEVDEEYEEVEDGKSTCAELTKTYDTMKAPIKAPITYKTNYAAIDPEHLATVHSQLASLSPLPSQIRNALLDVEAGPGGLFKCIDCSYTCKTSSRLIPHYKQTHLLGRTEQCNHCERLFIDRNDLQQHMRVAHNSRIISSSRCFKCQHPRCSFVFNSAAEVHAHMRTHFKGAGIAPVRK